MCPAIKDAAYLLARGEDERRERAVREQAESLAAELHAPLESGARIVVRAHADEVEELSTEEEGCVLNINDPDALQKALLRAD